jgi:hypothetical protein
MQEASSIVQPYKTFCARVGGDLPARCAIVPSGVSIRAPRVGGDRQGF